MTQRVPTTLREYRLRVDGHRQRVRVLGGLIAGKHGDVDSLTVRVLELHDVEKYVFLPLLWRYFGRGQGKVARFVFDVMNRVGAAVVFFATLEMRVLFSASFDARLTRARQIERIADVIDRSADPTNAIEFGQPNKGYAAFLPAAHLAEARHVAPMARMLHDLTTW